MMPIPDRFLAQAVRYRVFGWYVNGGGFERGAEPEVEARQAYSTLSRDPDIRELWLVQDVVRSTVVERWKKVADIKGT